MCAIGQNRHKIVFLQVNIEQINLLSWYIVTCRVNSYPIFIWLLCIVDDFSHATRVYSLRGKSCACRRIVNFCCTVKTKFGTFVKKVHSDNLTEFTMGELQDYFLKWGILHETSCVGTPQQNGLIEWKNRHLLNVARALRFKAILTYLFLRKVCSNSYISH